METKKFRQIIHEEIESCLQEILPVVVRKVLKEQLTPIVKAMINERKQTPVVQVQSPNYITEMKKVVNKPVEMQPASYPNGYTKAATNSTNPLANMLAETYNSMLPDEYEDYDVPSTEVMEGYLPAPPSQNPLASNIPSQQRKSNQIQFEAPVMESVKTQKMPGMSPEIQQVQQISQLPQAVPATQQPKSVIAVLKPKIKGPIQQQFNPEADIDNVVIDSVPDFNKLMENRTWK